MESSLSRPLPQTIAIDGPAASGKSTVGGLVAKRLGYICLDTGIMYRAVASQAIEHGVPVDNEAAITALAESLDIDVSPPSVDDGRQFDVFINRHDRSWAIRTNEVNQNVSEVSVYPGVRKAMTELQRKIAQKGNIIMLGRDIGTVVLPDADLKIYLDASVCVRAERRLKEEVARGNPLTFDDVVKSLAHRDQLDSTRKLAPLRAAEDAIVVDTDNLDIDAAVERLLEIIYAWEN